MIKGLEALKELRENVCYFAIGDYAYPRLDTIEKELKAFEVISKAYGDYANHKISEYELIMIVGENTTY